MIKTVNQLTGLLGIPKKDLVELSKRWGGRYRVWPLKQGSKSRTVEQPPEALRRVQQLLVERLFRRLPWPPFMVGGLPRMSPTTNAMHHQNAYVAFKTDIRQCFPSITRSLIATSLVSKFGFGRDVATIISYIVTYENHIPTGAVTSTYVSNCVMCFLLQHHYEQCLEVGATMTVYIDDVVISIKKSSDNLDLLQPIAQALCATLRRNGLKPHPSKTGWMKKGREPILITGINSGNRIGIPSSYLESVLLLAIRTSSFRECPSLHGKLTYIKNVNNIQYYRVTRRAVTIRQLQSNIEKINHLER